MKTGEVFLIEGVLMKLLKPAKLSKLAMGLILLLPVLSGADTPATQPDTNPPTAIDGGQMRPRFMGRGMAAGSRQEWDEMMDFMRKNSPNRARVLAESDAYESPRRFAILKRWRDYKFVAERFPEIADLRVQRFQTEDAIFGLELQARRDPANFQNLRPLVQAKAAELVQLSIEERQRRIEKMESLLEQEKQKLASDQAGENQLIDQRTDRIMQRMARAAGRDDATTQPSAQPQQPSSQQQPPQRQPGVISAPIN
jgi:hypothetical protein